MLGFATDTAASFKIGVNDTQVGVLTFSDFVSPEIYLDDYDSSRFISAVQ